MDGAFGRRGSEDVGIEEVRLLIASVAGPRRIAIAGRKVPFENLQVGQSVQVASNQAARSLYVEVRAMPPGAPPLVLIGSGRVLSESGALPVDLASEPFFAAVLLPSEDLWLRTLVNGASVIVSSVQV